MFSQLVDMCFELLLHWFNFCKDISIHVVPDDFDYKPQSGAAQSSDKNSAQDGEHYSEFGDDFALRRDGIEPWIRDLRGYLETGGRVRDLRRQIEDSGLKVTSAIGFAQWIVDDESKRKAGLEEARRDMDLIRSIGGKHIAAPPVGAHQPNLDSPSLDQIADRYRALCELGAQLGVHPQLELWGFSPNLHRLSEIAYVSTAAAHPMACVLPDFYHIYKGGNDFESLAMLEASKMHCFHINDYPSDIPMEKITDKDRVFPGDGDCELPKIIRRLVDNGFRGTFSLELFHPGYWKRDAVEVVAEGLLKSRAVLNAAIA